MEFKLRALPLQLPGHAQQRRHPDAASQQDAAPRRHQGKAIARLADLDDVAGLDPVVQDDRPASRILVAQHADPVVRGLGTVVGQRILAYQAAGHVNVDMRTGAEPGQGSAIEADEVEADDIDRLDALVRNLYRQLIHERNTLICDNRLQQ